MLCIDGVLRYLAISTHLVEGSYVRSGVLLVAVSTTHGRSGCLRALAAKMSCMGPLKSAHSRSAVGSGISAVDVEPMVVTCEGSRG
jgi:hypothetical protein